MVDLVLRFVDASVLLLTGAAIVGWCVLVAIAGLRRPSPRRPVRRPLPERRIDRSTHAAAPHAAGDAVGAPPDGEGDHPPR